MRRDRGSRHAGGRPRKYELRRVVDALLYVVKTGCQWRQLPSNFPPWLSVHQRFPLARRWERVARVLREQGRRSSGRNATPTVAIIDSQWAKTTGKGGARVRRGQKDQGPQAAHRRRYAGQPARGGSPLGGHSGLRGCPRRADASVSTLQYLVKVFADGGYTGTLIAWAKAMFGYDMEVVKRNEMHAFKVLPKRWIVERSFAWMGSSRRLSKAYELCPTSEETMIWISFSNTLLRRIT